MPTHLLRTKPRARYTRSAAAARRTLLGAVAAVCTSVLLAAGCAGDDDDEQVEPDTRATLSTDAPLDPAAEATLPRTATTISGHDPRPSTEPVTEAPEPL